MQAGTDQSPDAFSRAVRQVATAPIATAPIRKPKNAAPKKA